MREKKLHGERINYAEFEYYYTFFCGRFAVVCYLCYSLITIISICNFANVILIQERNSINFFCCPPIFRGREGGRKLHWNCSQSILQRNELWPNHFSKHLEKFDRLYILARRALERAVGGGVEEAKSSTEIDGGHTWMHTAHKHSPECMHIVVSYALCTFAHQWRRYIFRRIAAAFPPNNRSDLNVCQG